MKSIKAVLLALLLGSSVFASAQGTQTEVTVEKDQTVSGKKTFSKGVTLGPILFANLTTTPPQTNGTIVAVSDASATKPCTGGGTGAFAERINGVWDCSGGGGGASPFGSDTQIQIKNGGGFGAITNAAKGSVLASQGTSTAPIFQTKQGFDVRDFGVDCTHTTDSTAAIQAMIDAAPDFSSFTWPANCWVKVSSATPGTPAITIDRRIGLQFIFHGRNGNACAASGISNPSGLDYTSTYSSGNKVFYVNRSQELEFRNITIYTSNGGTDAVFDVDQVGATPPIMTRSDWYSPCIRNPSATRNPNFAGFRFSFVSTNDVENMHLYHPDIQCSGSSPTSNSSNGTAVFQANSANLKNNIVDDLRASNCSIDLNASGGDTTMQFGLDSNSWTAAAFSGFNQELSGFRSENMPNSVLISSAIGPYLLQHNDFAAAGGTIVDCPTGCGQLTMINNQQDSSATLTVNPHNSGGGPLIALNNRNMNVSPIGMESMVIPGPANSVGAYSTWDRYWIGFPLRLTPNNASVSAISGTRSSPALYFDTLQGAGQVYDHFSIQGVPNFADTSVGLNINYLGSAVGYIGLGATVTGLKVGPNATALSPQPTISPRGTTGATSDTYLIQANTITGHADCSTAGTIANANAVLNSTNFNALSWDPYPGAVSYSIYRTAAGGTPSTTGLIGTVKGVVQSVSPVGNTDILGFADTGLAGDASTCVTGNTTGKLLTMASSTATAGLNLPHGTAPTSPVNGDCWTTTSGLFCRINGTTVGPFSAGGVPPWSTITNPAGNLSLSMGTNTTAFSFGDYGASPSSAIYSFTDSSVTSTDTSNNFVLNTGGSSRHNPFVVQSQGVNQFQVCWQPGPQGEIVVGSAVACSAINQSPFAKFVAMSNTATHVVQRLYQNSSAATATMIEWNNATAAGTGFNFFKACAGATGSDTGCGSGTIVSSLRGDGLFTASSIVISGLTPGTSPVCPNGTGGALTTSGCSGGGGTPGGSTLSYQYNNAGSFAGSTIGTNQGTYVFGRVNTVQGTATTPIEFQVGDCASPGTISGAATTYTVLYTDVVGCNIVHDRAASGTATITIPTPTTLNNVTPIFVYSNYSPQNDTLTPTTFTISQGTSAAGASLTVNSGFACKVQPDPVNISTWKADCHQMTTTGSGGTVTTFSAGNLSPLFTTSVATATTTPALTFSLSNAAANTIFGNFTGSSAAPSFSTINGGSSCGDSTHALSYTNGTGIGCQTIDTVMPEMWLPYATAGPPQASSTGNTGQGANAVTCRRFTNPRTITPGHVTINIGTASAGQSVNVGIYDSSLSLLKDSGAISCTTTGGQTVAISGLTLNAGTSYYACAAFTDTTCAVTGAASVANISNIANKNANRDITSCTNSLAAGALPGTCGTPTTGAAKSYFLLLEP